MGFSAHPQSNSPLLKSLVHHMELQVPVLLITPCLEQPPQTALRHSGELRRQLSPADGSSLLAVAFHQHSQQRSADVGNRRRQLEQRGADYLWLSFPELLSPLPEENPKRPQPGAAVNLALDRPQDSLRLLVAHPQAKQVVSGGCVEGEQCHATVIVRIEPGAHLRDVQSRRPGSDNNAPPHHSRPLRQPRQHSGRLTDRLIQPIQQQYDRRESE
mmetsp:Transcript_61009/g.163655  ORF Transcript_61009/g.163655 Transcript_61009/m.163655 type:complete len:215 (-) Transcript_61009:1236-1880(-)